MRRYIILFLIQLAVLLGAYLPVVAVSIPASLSYQGTMVDKAGQPISASKSMVFSLYTVSSGGTAFWTETQTIGITNGLFSAQLGANLANPINLTSFGGDTWLGVKIVGEPEMTPRQKMTSVPYAFNGVPKGGIIMWSGSIATIPQGWALCDGTNATPDLRDRFVVGAGSGYVVGTIGGEATHTLTTSEMPSHNHSVIDGLHSHSDRLLESPSGGDIGYGGSYGALVGDINSTYSHKSYLSVSNISIGYSGSNSPHENRPPYYALAYIMKL